jgi:hypothetical protein
MKAWLVFLMLLGLSPIVGAQSSLHLRSTDGTFFVLVLDGKKQSVKPETQIALSQFDSETPLITLQILKSDGTYFNYQTHLYLERYHESHYTLSFSANQHLTLLLEKKNRLPAYTDIANPQGQNTSDAVLCEEGFRNFEFTNYLNTVKNQPSDTNRLIVAQQGLRNRKLQTSQALQIMKIFAEEQTRLDFVKEIINRLCDPQSIFLLNNGFKEESSISEFNQFLEGK